MALPAYGHRLHQERVYLQATEYYDPGGEGVQRYPVEYRTDYYRGSRGASVPSHGVEEAHPDRRYDPLHHFQERREDTDLEPACHLRGHKVHHRQLAAPRGRLCVLLACVGDARPAALVVQEIRKTLIR